MLKRLILRALALASVLAAGAYPAAAQDSLGQFRAGGTTSAELARVLSDETGSGAAVFGTGPTLTNPVINGTTVSNTPAQVNGATVASDVAVFDNTTGRLITSGYQLLTSFTANTLLGNATASPSATVAQVAFPSCTPGNGTYLGWTSGTGPVCSSTNFSIVKANSTSSSYTSSGTGEQFVTSYKLATAGAANANQCWRVTLVGSWTNSANTKTIVYRLGTSSTTNALTATALVSTALTATGQNGTDQGRVICNNNSTSAQRIIATAWGSNGTVGAAAAYKAPSVNTASNDLYLGVSVNFGATSETFAVDQIIIEQLPAI